MNVALFGGSGGLGKQLAPLLQAKHHVIALSSSDVRIEYENEVAAWFATNKVDVVINMAVINRDAMVHKTTFEDIQTQTDVNLKGTAYILKHCIPKMRAQSFGRIILVSSVLSQRPVMGAGIYAACKAFIDNLAKTTALENAKHGITCNSIVLGYFDGGLAHKLPQTFRDDVIRSIPLQRLGTVQELYQAIDFLIQTEYATGTNLLLAGGL